ncbi:MAG: D-tyrosyl-tRNA(Tyr) deacylase [Spirochaetales bacterium]|nr:D-tyrosyl-tRNA(Tyr) deacylase [Spirochaetales bacterium]
MRAVVQVCKNAKVTVGQEIISEIDFGMLVYLGVSSEDDVSSADYIVDKLSRIRIFKDLHGKTNLDIVAAGGDFLIISQFTLFGDLRKGRRPSYNCAAEPEVAKNLYEYVVEKLRKNNHVVKTGSFGDYMQVSYTNDGPQTYLLDSEKKI